MPQHKNGRRRGFGAFAGDLRDSLGESQEVFAERLCVSRSLIAAVEGGHKPPSKIYLEALTREFPERKSAIEAAARLHRPRGRPKYRRDLDSFFRDADALIVSSKDQEAWDLLMDRAKGLSDLYQMAWLLVYLGQLSYTSFAISASPKSLPVGLLDWASACARQLTTAAPDKKIIELWDEIINSYTLVEHPEIAYGRLTEALRRCPKAGKLWHRMASMCFEQGRFALAYAASNTALRHHAKRIDVLMLRGEILAEWGEPSEAVLDLHEVLKGKLSPMRRASARCAKGLALFREGKISEAITELLEVEGSAPDDPRPQYFLGKCFEVLASQTRIEGEDAKSVDLEREAEYRFANADDFLSPPLPERQRFYAMYRRRPN